MNPIRVAIIGAGGIANSHAATLKKEPDVQVVACCDILPDSVKTFAVKHSIPSSYTDYRELLRKESLNAVTVAASDRAHAEVSIAALKKGLHVLCEKPLATSSAEAGKMLRAAQGAGKVNMVNLSYRSMPALERARRLVRDGFLGTVRHVEASYLQSWLANECWGDWREKPAFLWRMSRRHFGGTLADLGCHIFDFATYVAGDITRLQCVMKCYDKGVRRNTWKGYKLDADDSFFASVEFANGALGVVHSTRWATGHTNALRLRVFGDSGGLVVDSEAGRDKVQICTGKFHARNTLWNTVPAGVEDVPVIVRFIRSIRLGVVEPPTFEDGFKARVYQDACLASARTGKPVRIRGGN